MLNGSLDYKILIFVICYPIDNIINLVPFFKFSNLIYSGLISLFHLNNFIPLSPKLKQEMLPSHSLGSRLTRNERFITTQVSQQLCT